VLSLSSSLAVNGDQHSMFVFAGAQVAYGDTIHCFQRGNIIFAAH